MDILDSTSPTTGKTYRQEIMDDIRERDSQRIPAPPFTVPSTPPTTAARSTPPMSSSQKILSLYRLQREELAAFLKTEGNIFARGGSPVGDYVGLANQGATCYLNSLVQALFMLPCFRVRIFKFRHNEELHGKVEFCIPAQLQILFARLRMSSRPYVSTKALTRSFGWGSAEGFQQHDVQELLVTLMEALERSTPKCDFAKDLFQGTTSDYLKGEGFCRRKAPVAFNNLMVPIQGHDTLEGAITDYFSPDVLNGNNQYDYDGKKVDALKGVEVNELPPVFIVNLGRFVFDYQTMRRVKINDACSFPESINMDNLLKGFVASASENKENGSPVVKNNVGKERENQKEQLPLLGNYELIATMIHSGTAQGGHYRAFIREQSKKIHATTDADESLLPPRSWYNFNDSFVSKLTADEVVTMFGRESTTAETAVVEKDDGVEDTKKETQVTDVTEEPEEAAVKHDDDSVAPIKEEKKKDRAKHVARSATSSYMLMYKKIEPPATAMDEQNVDDDDVALLPAELKASILSDNVLVENMAKVYAAKSKIARLTVCVGAGSHFGTVEMLKSATLAETTQEAVRVMLSDTDNDNQHRNTEYRLRSHEPSVSRPGRTYGGRENETLVQLGLSNGTTTLLLEARDTNTDPAFQEYDPNDFYIQLDQWRAESLDTVPYPKIPTLCIGKQKSTVKQLMEAVSKAIFKHNNSSSSIDDNIGKYTLVYLDRRDGVAVRLDSSSDDSSAMELRLHHKIHSGSSLVLERTNVDPDIVLDYERAQNVIVLRYNIPRPKGVKKSMAGSIKYDIELRCDKRDTLQTIKEQIHPTLGIENIQHFRLKCNANAPVLKKLSDTLGDNGFSNGSILHVERGIQLTMDDVMIQVFKYAPYDSNGKYYKRLIRIPINKHYTIAQVKAKIAKAKALKGHLASKMRLHQMKKTEGSGVHPLMRDDKTLDKCVKLLKDDTKLCVRLLAVPETVTKDDAVIVVKLWRPLSGEFGTLDRGEDVVVNKYVTATAMRQAVESVFSLTMGGVEAPLCLAKSHMTSVDARDLKKKTLEIIEKTADPSSLLWVELPSEASESSGNKLSASDVGGLPTPAMPSMDMLMLKTPIGGLRDGTILFLHQGNELKRAVTKWTTVAVDGSSESGENAEGRSGRRTRNPNWKSGAIPVDGKKRSGAFPRRGKEVGIKIRTPYDDVLSISSEKVDEKVEGEQKDTVVAGGAVQAARVLNKV